MRNAAASSEVSNPEIGVQGTGDVQAILFDMVRQTIVPTATDFFKHLNQLIIREYPLDCLAVITACLLAGRSAVQQRGDVAEVLAAPCCPVQYDSDLYSGPHV